MRKTKPSKAPWIVKPDYGKENVYRLWNKDSNYHDDTSPEAMDANAALMEAGPELLTELIGFLRVYDRDAIAENITPNGARITVTLSQATRVRALIAKAEGRTA